ncbi:MAG: four helix bundle protein [Calditrichaeota bacterium]|nr:four helix bundle protein [Calditrichota bacterium]
MNLEKRFVQLSSRVIKNTEFIKRNFAGITLKQQLTRSIISVALNYSEAKSAESSKDYVHKISISLKELKESRTAIEILIESNLVSFKLFETEQNEINELLAILYASKRKANQNN